MCKIKREGGVGRKKKKKMNGVIKKIKEGIISLGIKQI